jgi:hypothetical protein
MAYILEITKPKCRCGKAATVIVFNRFNAEYGKYCRRHGEQELAFLKQQEKESTLR